MKTYEFGAGGFKLGDRVEVLTTGQRGVLVAEVVHITGCNTYQVLLANALKGDIWKKTTHRDHLILRKLEPNESLFDNAKELTDENSFSPKGTDVNAEWIRAAHREKKEAIIEIDDAVGVEEISIQPGMEVWNKVYGRPMVVSHILRDIFSKELEYGLVYMEGDKEELLYCRAYGLVPMEQKIDVYLEHDGKYGSVFNDDNDIIFGNDFSIAGTYGLRG